MPRRVFFSFHYKADAWRAAQVRNAGVVEGNNPVSDNDWEAITRGGEDSIKRWIHEQMEGRSCCVVLIGAQTAERKWVQYEIAYAWDKGKGVVGVYIHNLKDREGRQAAKGRNPFDMFTLGNARLSSIVRAYDPPYTDSIRVYDYIKKNLGLWVEEAIEIRNKYGK